MIDLRQRLSELDQLEAPDMRADIERRTADLVALPRDPTTEPAPQLSPWRGPLIALGTAVAILAIVAGVVMLLLRDDAGEVTDQTPTHPPTTTTLQGAFELYHRGEVLDVGWKTIQLPERPGVFTRLSSGLWVGLEPGWRCRSADGYHASCPLYGEWSDPAADPTEILWTSTNGTDWTPHEVPELAGMTVHPTSFDQGLVAQGGLLWIEVSPSGEIAPTQTWITEDGETWHQVEWIADPLLPNTWSWPDAISRSNDVVFVTMQRYSGATQHLVSADAGRRFIEIEPFPPGRSAITHWSADGELRALVEDQDYRLTLWRSVDGHHWDLLGNATGIRAWDLAVVSASDEAIIAGSYGVRCDYCLDAAGTVSLGDLPVVSRDGGLTWHELDVVAAMPPKSESYLDRGVAIGSINEWFIIRRHNLVWVSRNGQDWYSIEGGAALEAGYGTSNSVLHVAEGILVPPTE